jgi:xanthine dehydrogenase YagR molybdenum-binding subunit
MTHHNKPTVAGLASEEKIKESRIGLPVLHTDSIYFKGQPVAVVIAKTLEEAQYAASLVKTLYQQTKANVDFKNTHSLVPLKNEGKERGNIENWKNSAFNLEEEYHIEGEVHHPMEMHATIAIWNGDDKLKLYDKNQGVNGVQNTVGKLFGLQTKNIEVITEFMGGGFGSGLRVWPNTILAIMAAKKVNRPVKLMLTRNQMSCLVGYRPESWQKVKLGADASGKFTGLLHDSKNTTSLYENFLENITRISRLAYGFENLKTQMATVPLNLSTPTWMRGPGECTGAFALESAIDELCFTMNKDPLATRLQNLSDVKDPETGKDWSTNFIRECMEKGAEKIGWNERNLKPRQKKDGDWLIGYGMGIGMWTAGRGKASAALEMDIDGNIVVKTAMTDIGTGTGTSMRNIVHEITGVPLNKIKIDLGKSTLPQAPSQGGSRGLSSISASSNAIAETLKSELIAYAAKINPEFKNLIPSNIILTDSAVQIKNTSTSVSFQKIFSENKLTVIEVEETTEPGALQKNFAFASGAAHFCRVKVNELTGKVKIDRFVSVVDGGKIVSEKPAKNQVIGAVVGGTGMALMEEMRIDKRIGALVAEDLAGYHFAVNADVPIIEVDFINKPDFNLNASGAKGLGEVGIIGSAAAIANAIFNATGKRFRNLPITPDKILKG